MNDLNCLFFALSYEYNNDDCQGQNISTTMPLIYVRLLKYMVLVKSIYLFCFFIADDDYILGYKLVAMITLMPDIQ